MRHYFPMITLRFSPTWFEGIDIYFDILGVIVTFLLGIYSYKFYKFSNNYRYKFFGLSFICFSGSFLAKIATNIVIYNHVVVRETLSNAVMTQNLIQQSNFFFHLGFDIHRFLMLLGLIGIYWLVSKGKQKEHLWIMVFMALIISVFSFSSYFIFHLTAAFLLLFIVKHYHCICTKKSVKKKNMIAHMNFGAFLALFISQIVFIFVWLFKPLYAIAETIQFLGFLLLFINLSLLVFGHGKKKNKN